MGRENHDLLQFFKSLSERKDDLPETFNLGGILAAIIGVSCLVYVVLMCVCRDSGQNKRTKDVEVKTNKKSVEAQNGADLKSVTGVGHQADGGGTVPAPDATSGHQANSISANGRASLARLLPAPPVSGHQTHAKQTPGYELPSSGVRHGGHISDVNNQQSHSKNVASLSAGGKEISRPDNSDYEHLGPKVEMAPSDYDSLNELKSQDRPAAASPEASESSDDDYTELDDKTYPEVIDLSAKRKELSVPYYKVKDEVELKEEDPYNHIGESDGTVSAQVLQQLKSLSHHHVGDSDGSVSAASIGTFKQLREQDDPYATVQDDSAGTFKNVQKAGEITQGSEASIFYCSDCKLVHDSHPYDTTVKINAHHVTGTTNHFDISESLSKGKRDVEEYAVVHKTKGEGKRQVRDQEEGSGNTGFSPYGVIPHEPPRLYAVLDVEEDVAAQDTPRDRTKHKYSKITARESLANISARTCNENPYESMPDTPEDAYTLVEDSAVEEMEIMCRAGGLGGNRLSQISDTYDEIGISGGSVNYTNTGSHLEKNKNIAVSSTMASVANKQQISSSGNQSNHNITSAGVASNSSNHEDVQEYEDVTGTYVTLEKESAYEPQGTPHLSNNLTVHGQTSGNRTVQEVKAYADYENMDETRECVVHTKTGLVDKKVGQRRRILDPKQQGI